MGKVDEWLGRVRDTFINASSLAETVRGLQVQVNEMSATMESLRRVNTTLEENLSWSRSERERLETTLAETRHSLNTATKERDAAKNDLDYWKHLAEDRASTIANLRTENDTLTIKNLELEDDNKAMKAKVSAVESALGIVKVAEEVIAKEEPKQETAQRAWWDNREQDEQQDEPKNDPPVVPWQHPITGVVQEREVETGKFHPVQKTEDQGY